MEGLGGKTGDGVMRIDPNELVFTFGNSYVSANFTPSPQGRTGVKKGYREHAVSGALPLPCHLLCMVKLCLQPTG